MRTNTFAILGKDLRSLRKVKGLTQPQLAMRLGRDPARISELERDLLQGRAGKDRLTLFTQICETLDVTPVLVPNARLEAVTQLLEPRPAASAQIAPGSVFDDVFVDLSPDEPIP